MKIILAVVLLACCCALRIQDKMKHKTHNKIRSKKSQGEMRSEFFQKIFRDDSGKCIWGDTERQVSEYPTIIKDFFKPVGELCTKDNCRTQKEVLDAAAVAACANEKSLNDDQAIYYVNTRRLQKGDVFRVKQDMLNQFTYAILPSKLDAINPEVKPILFTIVVPASQEVQPYEMSKCPFDMSMGQDEDKENEKNDSCFFNIAKDTRITLKFKESDAFKKYWAQKKQQEENNLLE